MLTIACAVIALVFWPVTLLVLAIMYWPITLTLLAVCFAIWVVGTILNALSSALGKVCK